MLFDAVLGYCFPRESRLAGFEVQVNGVNLFDKNHIGPLGSGQLFNTATLLSNTLQAGSPREVSGTIRKRF